MKIDLEVLASTEIRRKKPWPRIIWIGEEQESLLLLDAPGKRVSVLYVPSGKTKRRLSKITPLVEQVKCFTSTRNGRYLLGLLNNGELFIWHKDKDISKFIAGFDRLVDDFSEENFHINASDSCSHIFVSVGNRQFFLWAMEKGETILRDKVTTLKGTWHEVSVPAGMELPPLNARETSIASVFYENVSLGHCFQCSMVFNSDRILCVATVVLKFPDPALTLKFPDIAPKNLPVFTAEWSLLQYPFQQMHAEFEPVSTLGAYVSAYSSSGQVLAVAANQRFPSRTTMLFVSPLTDTVLVGGMGNCGVSDVTKTGRQYWVSDLAWTSDNLFLAGILKNGSVCLIPRLGDPVAIATDGCSVTMGPSLFLPLHPAIFVSGNDGNLEPSAEECDPMRQQFSVATHPSLPIVLFSDGFLVTVAQLPVEVTSVTLMRGLVLESAKYLKKLAAQENLDMTVADAYRLSRGQKGSKQNLSEVANREKSGKKRYEFEMAEVSLNATNESEVSIIETTNRFGFDQFGAIGNMEAGKIVFGEPEMISIDPNATFSGLEASTSLLKYLEGAMSSLTLVWKLGASYSEVWSAEVDNVVKQAVHNLSKIFNVVLDCPAVDAIMPILTPRQSSAIQNPRVYNIIVAYRNILQLLRFDTYNQHLIPAALRLVHKTITLMLTSKELENTDPRLKTLFGCFSLLKHAETSLNRIYVWVPSENGASPSSSSPRTFEPGVLVKKDAGSGGSGNRGQLPGKRLAATWKCLYRHVLEYQSKIATDSDTSGDIPHTEKLLDSIQRILHDGDEQITPRSAAAKLSPVWLRHVFPFDLLSNSDSFMYTDDDQNTTNEPKSSTPSPNNSTPKSDDQNVSQLRTTDMDLSFGTATIKNNNCSTFERDPSLTSTLRSEQKSILKSGQRSNDSNINVQSLSTSSPTVDENTSSNGAVTPKGTSLKVAGLSTIFRYDSSPSSGQSSARSPKGVGAKFKLFNKIKSAVSKPKSEKSTLRVGSVSSSSKENSSSSSFMSAIRSQLKIRSYSSSPKESSSQNTSSTMPIIMLDITENGSLKNEQHATAEIETNNFLEKGQITVKSEDIIDPKSEGFEVHAIDELERTISMESKLFGMKKKKHNLLKSEKLSVDGQHTQALEAWKDQLRQLKGRKDSPKTSKMLHAVLYTYLLKDDLRAAVDFIDSIILQASVDIAMSSQELPAYEDGTRPPLMTLVTHRSQDSEEEELVPCIKNRAIRQTVQSMARFMAAYFSNQTMFIYPPHSAQPLPTVHLSQVPTKSRIIPKYHEEVTNVITQDNLSSVWTTERTVEYLLLSGLVCETAWFAHKMGDWKTGYLLSVAHTSHREIAPQLYRKFKKPLGLGEDLTPARILQEKLAGLIRSNRADSTPAVNKQQRYFIPINTETNISQLTRTLGDIFTAGIVSDVELAPWFLATLIAKLKSVVCNLSPLVATEFYLPAPPLFCPQPGEIETGTEAPDVQYEGEIRMEISSIIQLVLVALNSAHLSLPSARWYIQELFKMQERAAQFKATTEGPCLELPEILQQYKIFRSEFVDLRQVPSVHEVLDSFRDFCTILWLLHVRDKLSKHLRMRGTHLNEKDGQESPESTLGKEYIQECFELLKWAVHMLTFSQYIADDGCIRKIILSLILELPATEDTADILAEHFYAPQTYDPEVQEKLERLVTSWQSIEVVPEDDGKSARLDEKVVLSEEGRKSQDSDDVDEDSSVRKSVTFYQASPRAKTLSVYFHKQCDVVQKVLKKKRKIFGQYDEFVFSSEAETESENGSSGNICIGSRSFETKQSYLEFLDRFYAICFTKVVERESESGKAKMHAILLPFSKQIREAELEAHLSKNEETYQKKTSSVVMASPRAKFFRSQSESQMSDEKDSASHQQKRNLFRSNSSGNMAQSPKQSGMSKFVSEGSLFGKSRPPSSPSRAKPNMTVMASRFFHSEEVLYRDVASSEEVHWILDVNFGQRYLALQHLLDYLHHWAGKQNLLGLHGKGNKDLGLKPTMRIEVPTQLVVLGLWLLENKYDSGKKQKYLGNDRQDEFETKADAQVENTPRTPRDRAKKKALQTVEEITEHDSFTQVSNIPRSRSHSPKGQRPRSPSPKQDASRSQSAGFDMSRDRTLDFVRSITSTQEETEQMKTAYKKVLDGGDDSSSLEVSSLEEEAYEADLKQQLSIQRSGSGRAGRSKSLKLKSSQRLDSSPDSRNNSALNHTLQLNASPERGSHPPITSTPLMGNSPSSRLQRSHQVELQSADVSRVTMPPAFGLHGNNTAPPRPPHYRGGLLGGDPAHTAPSVMNDVQAGTQAGAGNPVNVQGMDLAQQLQLIVRGELRRMMEVQHQSMIAMMGALDGVAPPIAMQQLPANQMPAYVPMEPPSANQTPAYAYEEIPQEQGGRRSLKGKNSIRNVLGELRNLQDEEKKQTKKRSRSSPGKENMVDSPLRISELRPQQNIEVYRVDAPDAAGNLYPHFLRIQAERESDGVRFPPIPRNVWGSQFNFVPSQDIPDMPLLQVDRTVPGHKFPVSQRSQSLPRYIPEPGFFHPAPPPPQSNLPRQPSFPLFGTTASSDSGIGMPLLRFQNEEERQGRAPRFGELLPPEQVIESVGEAEKKLQLRERYLREYHQLQAEKATQDYKRHFGEHLLKMDLEERPDKSGVASPQKAQRTPSPRKTPRTPRSVSEQISSKSSKKSKKMFEFEPEDNWDDQPISDELSDEQQPISERPSQKQQISERHSARQPMGEEEGEESEADDITEAETMTEEEEEPLHDGYAIKQGEFEAYLALENALAKTKDTHARIQLKTALRLQRQRMTENWKRPKVKVDFATNTAEQLDMGTDPEHFPPEPAHVRYAEKATSITKDTGVDPIQEAVIEYNQSRQPNVLPPDIYMGLRFNEHDQASAKQQGERGRSYLNVVDLNASSVLNDLRERPETTEPRLDVSLTEEQMRLRSRIAQEERARTSYEAPVIERPTRADALTVKMFETKTHDGQDRFTMAIVPRDSMPESKFIIMQRLREMNSQLAAIDHMSNNIEREFKSTRLAIHTLEEMTEAMQPPRKQDLDDIDEDVPERLVDSRSDTRSESRTLTPQLSAKSPIPSVRTTARSTGRSKKSARDQKKEMSAELARVSGLSGISDIIGEMVAHGEIDIEDVGLSRREADRLVQRGIIRQEQAEDARVSLDEIKKMADIAHRDGAQDREALREWMATKRSKQMEEYKRHLEELREREPRPFRPAHENFDQSFTMRERKEREESRKEAQRTFMTRRLDEAQHLLGNILTDKPQLPQEPAPRPVTTKQRMSSKDRSPASMRDRIPVKAQTAPDKKTPQGILKVRDSSPPFTSDYDVSMEGYDSRDLDLDLEEDWDMHDQLPQQLQPRSQVPKTAAPVPAKRIDVSPARGPVQKGSGVVPKLKLGLEDVDEEEPVRLQQTGETTGELTEYYKAMQDMDVSFSQDNLARQQSVEETKDDKPSATPQKTFKPKSFTEIVRLQRPDRTRKQPNKFALNSGGRVQSVSQSETSRTSVRTQTSQREQEMIRGTKRSPMRKSSETGPRRVKTYAERLQEMKSGEKFSTPVAPKSHLGSSIASTTARPTSRPVKPKHKPMTYVEQLKKLNQPHHKPRVGGQTTILQKPMVRSHKPPHQPKTYAQQLQELQPAKTFTGAPIKRPHKTHGATRQRPYQDPYRALGPSDLDQLETASIVSGWSMGEDVRNILYDGESSIAVGRSASYAPSDQISDYYDVVMDNRSLGDDYTASVDIDDLVQIADGGSMSSGSMMSYIDWDQVDDLIADVR